MDRKQLKDLIQECVTEVKTELLAEQIKGELNEGLKDFLARRKASKKKYDPQIKGRKTNIDKAKRTIDKQKSDIGAMKKKMRGDTMSAAKEELVDPALDKMADVINNIGQKANGMLSKALANLEQRKGAAKRKKIQAWITKANTDIYSAFMDAHNSASELGLTDDEVSSYLSPLIANLASKISKA